MSDRSYEGYVSVAQVTGEGMITLRGDLTAAKIKSAVKSATGFAVPKQGMCSAGDDAAVAWMSPDELLITTDNPTDMAAKLETALAGQHAMVVDVSDARAYFVVEGAKVREILAKISPIDTHSDVLKPGMFRRTRLAQVAGAAFLETENKISIVAFRSVQDYVYELLCDAAKPGSEVNA